MEANIKRSLKRKTKILSRLFIAAMIMFVVYIIVLVYVGINNPTLMLGNMTKTILITTLLLLTTLMLSFGVYAQSYGETLFRYRKNIIIFRRRIHMRHVIKLVRNKNYHEAIEFYNSMKPSDIKDFLFAHLIGVLTMCDDEQRVKNANEAIDNVLDSHKPEEVFN